jgi:hypothetical protein
MQVEDKAGKRAPLASNVESALLFESPSELFARVLRILRPSCRAAVDVEFRPFVNAYSSARLSAGRLRIRLVDILEQAPAPVLESLAFLLLSKLFGLRPAAIHRHRYRMWMSRHDVRRKLHASRRERGQKTARPPEGDHHSLEAIFEALNLRFFGGMLARPNLGWSRTASRTRLGHYDPAHHTIVLSRVFDDPSVPLAVIEYVMYHEMLHLVHPPEHRVSRRVVHTQAFREAEKRFPDWKEVKGQLREFLQKPGDNSGSNVRSTTGA